MNLDELKMAVCSHAGEFLCERIHDEEQTKLVRFVHIIGSGVDADGLPDIGRLREFYQTFGSIAFYHDESSGISAKYVASPSEWSALLEAFGDWLRDLDEEECAEYVPDWVDSCLVIGETPNSGNYLLMATEGAIAGQIFEFEHDGFEFQHQANDLIAYIEMLLKPDASMLLEIASHMRFIEESEPLAQWWIRELRDNRGHVVLTST